MYCKRESRFGGLRTIVCAVSAIRLTTPTVIEKGSILYLAIRSMTICTANAAWKGGRNVDDQPVPSKTGHTCKVLERHDLSLRTLES